VIAWSATLEQFSGAAGPLHTRSKRFASLKNSPDKIAAMLAEIGEYEQLSANQDSAETFRSDAESRNMAGRLLARAARIEQHEQDGGDSGPDLLLMAEAGEYESEADGEVLPDSEHVAEAGAEVERGRRASCMGRTGRNHAHAGAAARQ
jgi:hypothetical protein